MSRRRRILAMIAATVAAAGLGLVVAVSSRSRPGGVDEPWLDVSLQADIDLGPLLAWLLLITAVVGAVLFALGLKEVRPREQRRGRNLLWALAGLLVFMAMLRWLRPLAESVLVEAGESSEMADDVSDSSGGLSGAWILSVLLAAVTAAALTRIGMSIRSVAAPFEPSDGPGEADAPPVAHGMPPHRRELGDDPRSRILEAYAEFEARASASGLERGRAETEGRHARRVIRQLGLDPRWGERLGLRYADARYGADAPSAEAADEAAEAASRLFEGIDR